MPRNGWCVVVTFTGNSSTIVQSLMQAYLPDCWNGGNCGRFTLKTGVQHGAEAKPSSPITQEPGRIWAVAVRAKITISAGTRQQRDNLLIAFPPFEEDAVRAWTPLHRKTNWNGSASLASDRLHPVLLTWARFEERRDSGPTGRIGLSERFDYRESLGICEPESSTSRRGPLAIGTGHCMMRPMMEQGRRVWPVDWLHFGAFGVHLVLQLFTFGHMDHWGWWLAFDIAAPIVLIVIIQASRALSARGAALVRLIYGCAVVPLVFTQVGLTIQALGLPDLAPELESLDRAIFGGVNPLEALEVIVHPVATEILQWIYIAYLIFPPAVMILLALKGSPAIIARSLFSLLGVTYLTYMGYYLVPAMGPNVHNNFGPALPVMDPVLELYTFADDLPGIWIARELREWMFSAELTKKDCFPSAHAAISLACAYYAFRIGRVWGWICLPIALGIVVATIYLRYHFIVDMIVAVLLTVIAITVLERLHNRFDRVLFSAPPSNQGS